MDSLIRYKKAFGEVLRENRSAANLTVDEMAKRTGISPGTYRNLESGQRIPTVDQIEGFSELLGTTFDKFLKMSMEKFDKDIENEIKKLESDEALEYIRPVLRTDHDLRQKWNKEKEEIVNKSSRLAEDLIQAGQRYHTPNKYLTENDVHELAEQIMTLVDLRVRQVLRKHDKA